MSANRISPQAPRNVNIPPKLGQSAHKSRVSSWAKLNRFGQGPFNGPPIGNVASVGRVVGDLVLPRPHGERFGFPVELDVQRVAPIVGLFGARGPAAVTGSVWAVIVLALDAVFQTRAWRHVFDELRHIVSPLVTDADPASAIFREGAVIGVVASADQLGPDSVKRMIPKAVCRRSFSVSPARLRLMASARLCISGGHRRAANPQLGSACALAKPIDGITPALMFCRRGESVKRQSSQISHRLKYSWFVPACQFR